MQLDCRDFCLKPVWYVSQWTEHNYKCPLLMLIQAVFLYLPVEYLFVLPRSFSFRQTRCFLPCWNLIMILAGAHLILTDFGPQFQLYRSDYFSSFVLPQRFFGWLWLPLTLHWGAEQWWRMTSWWRWRRQAYDMHWRFLRWAQEPRCPVDPLRPRPDLLETFSTKT